MTGFRIKKEGKEWLFSGYGNLLGVSTKWNDIIDIWTVKSKIVKELDNHLLNHKEIFNKMTKKAILNEICGRNK